MTDITRQLKRSLAFAFSSAIFLIAGMAMAGEYQSLYQSLRPLGMGGAFTAVSDDGSAIFYNPAGLSHITQATFGVDTLVEMSESGKELIGDIDDTDFDNTDEVVAFLKEYVGDTQHVRAAMSPRVGFRVKEAGVMISALGQAKIDAEVHNPAWPELFAGIIVDGGVIGGAGMALPTVPGLRVGVSAKMIHRENLYNIYTATDIANDDFDPFEEDREKGDGFSLDLGLIYRLPFVQAMATDIAIAFQNVPEMDMGEAVDIESQTNIGIAGTKAIGLYQAILALDVRDITKNQESDGDLAKRIHMGGEVRFPKIFSLRAGFYQGYMSVGCSAAFKYARLDFASYVEEVGAYAGQRDDRRYALQLTVGK